MPPCTDAHLEDVVHARLDINIKVPGVSSDLVRGHEALLEVMGVVPLYLEVVDTLEVLHVPPAESDSVTPRRTDSPAQPLSHLSAIGRPLLSRTALIWGGAVKKKGSWNMQPPSDWGRTRPRRSRDNTEIICGPVTTETGETGNINY